MPVVSQARSVPSPATNTTDNNDDSKAAANPNIPSLSARTRQTGLTTLVTNRTRSSLPSRERVSAAIALVRARQKAVSSKQSGVTGDDDKQTNLPEQNGVRTRKDESEEYSMASTLSSTSSVQLPVVSRPTNYRSRLGLGGGVNSTSGRSPLVPKVQSSSKPATSSDHPIARTAVKNAVLRNDNKQESTTTTSRSFIQNVFASRSEMTTGSSTTTLPNVPSMGDEQENEPDSGVFTKSYSLSSVKNSDGSGNTNSLSRVMARSAASSSTTSVASFPSAPSVSMDSDSEAESSTMDVDTVTLQNVSKFLDSLQNPKDNPGPMEPLVEFKADSGTVDSDDDDTGGEVNAKTLAEIGAFIDAVARPGTLAAAPILGFAGSASSEDDSVDTDIQVPAETQQGILAFLESLETKRAAEGAQKADAPASSEIPNNPIENAKLPATKETPIYERLERTTLGEAKDPPAYKPFDDQNKADPPEQASPDLSEAVARMRQEDENITPSYSADSLESDSISNADVAFGGLLPEEEKKEEETSEVLKSARQSKADAHLALPAVKSPGDEPILEPIIEKTTESFEEETDYTAFEEDEEPSRRVFPPITISEGGSFAQVVGAGGSLSPVPECKTDLEDDNEPECKPDVEKGETGLESGNEEAGDDPKRLDKNAEKQPERPEIPAGQTVEPVSRDAGGALQELKHESNDGCVILDDLETNDENPANDEEVELIDLQTSDVDDPDIPPPLGQESEDASKTQLRTPDNDASGPPPLQVDNESLGGEDMQEEAPKIAIEETAKRGVVSATKQSGAKLKARMARARRDAKVTKTSDNDKDLSIDPKSLGQNSFEEDLEDRMASDRSEQKVRKGLDGENSIPCLLESEEVSPTAAKFHDTPSLLDTDDVSDAVSSKRESAKSVDGLEKEEDLIEGWRKGSMSTEENLDNQLASLGADVDSAAPESYAVSHELDAFEVALNGTTSGGGEISSATLRKNDGNGDSIVVRYEFLTKKSADETANDDNDIFMEQFSSLEVDDPKPAKEAKKAKTTEVGSSRAVITGGKKSSNSRRPQSPRSIAKILSDIRPPDNASEEQTRFLARFKKLSSRVVKGVKPSPVEAAQIRQAAQRAKIQIELVDALLESTQGQNEEIPALELPSNSSEEWAGDSKFDDIEELDEDEAISAFLYRFSALKTGGHFPNGNLEALGEFALVQTNSNDEAVEVDIEVGFVNRELNPYVLEEEEVGGTAEEEEEEEEWWRTASGQSNGPAARKRDCIGSGSQEPSSQGTHLRSDSSGSEVEAVDVTEVDEDIMFGPSEDARLGELAKAKVELCSPKRKGSERKRKQMPLTVETKDSLLASSSFIFESGENRGVWLRKSAMASYGNSWEKHKSWLSPRSSATLIKPRPIDGVAAAENLGKFVYGKKMLPLVRPWRLSYKERTRAHSGYFNVDIYSLYETSMVDSIGHELDFVPWEHRDVKQRFLYEQSIAFSRNWFGLSSRIRGNHKCKQPVCRPKSMEMPIENIPDPGEWTEEWYTTWKAPHSQRIYNGSYDFTSEGSNDSEDSTEGGSQASSGASSVSGSSVEPEDSDDESWEEAPECGTIINVKQKIGERVSRVHPDFTSSLRRSRWRKKYFPKGTFPY